MGPPCSGKSTFVQQSRAPGDVVIDFDEIAHAFGADVKHDAPEPIRQVAWAARRGAIARAFEGVEADVWLIQQWAPPDVLERYAAAGAVFHVMDTPLEVCLLRCAEDARPAETAGQIERWFADPPTLPGGEKGMTMKTKRVDFAVKSVGEDKGEFTGYASVFGNVDLYGDKVVPGAFEKSLQKFQPGGAGIPCYWNHDVGDPMKCIGETVEAKEDEHGLYVKVALDLDNPLAAQAYRLLKKGRVKQMSFAYHVKKSAWVEAEDEYYEELRELDLHEVSVVQIGANQETSIGSVKSGKSDNEAIKELTSAVKSLCAVIAARPDDAPQPVPAKSADGCVDAEKAARAKALIENFPEEESK
ncbi:HK97 family phage prohead protease [Dermabacteraceae bacterium P13088]